MSGNNVLLYNLTNAKVELERLIQLSKENQAKVSTPKRPQIQQALNHTLVDATSVLENELQKVNALLASIAAVKSICGE